MNTHIKLTEFSVTSCQGKLFDTTVSDEATWTLGRFRTSKKHSQISAEKKKSHLHPFSCFLVSLFSIHRGQVSHPNHSNENQQRGGELLVLFAGRGVLRECLGPGPDAEKAHTGEVPAGG